MICHKDPVIQRTEPFDSDPKFHLTHPFEVVRPIGGGRNDTGARFTWHATYEDAAIAAATWKWRNAARQDMDRLRLELIEALAQRAQS